VENNHLFQNLNLFQLDLRKDEEFRNQAWNAFNSNPPKSFMGVSRLSIWCELSSIIFPWAFVLDEMHLFWENIIPLLFNHWRGRFSTARASHAKKFEETNDSFNIKPNVWEKIGQGMEDSKSGFPTPWGDAFRHLGKHCHEFKAAEWRCFALLVAPIVFDDDTIMSEENYEHLCDLIEAMESATSDIPLNDIYTTIRKPLVEFLHHYERVFYQYDSNRLNCCRSQVHLLAHVADFVEWCGPMHLYSQWSCERSCGIISQSVRNRVQANRTTSLHLLRDQQMLNIPFLARYGKINNPHLHELCPEQSYFEQIIGSIIDVREMRSSRKTKLPVESMQDGPSIGTIGNLFLPPIGLYRPTKYSIKTHIRCYILQYLLDCNFKVSRNQIPKMVTAYHACKAPDDSIICSSSIAPSNTTRSCSHAEYIWCTKNGQKELFYGTVLLFL
jgi:hypothetical protein